MRAARILICLVACACLAAAGYVILDTVRSWREADVGDPAAGVPPGGGKYTPAPPPEPFKLDKYAPDVALSPQAPISDIPLKRAAEAGDAVGEDELVLGVVIGDEARAYPINQMTGPHREVFNDVLGGRAIAATW